jgi:hypothetical protein
MKKPAIASGLFFCLYVKKFAKRKLMYNLAYENFSQSACYLIWFGSHKEYDSIQAATINFDINILDFKTKKK